MLAAIVDVARVGLPVMGLLIALESTGIPLPGETSTRKRQNTGNFAVSRRFVEKP